MAEIDNLVINVEVTGDTKELGDIALLIEGIDKKTEKATSKMSAFGASIKNMLKSAAFIQTMRYLGNAVNKSMEYTENLNLFTVAMGKYADEARKYAEEVSQIMGIDPAEWMKAQGTFNILATGFGVAADKAAIMSKNLTQLGYDISSFYNINVQDAMLKLQSGLAGELEPLRRLGYDLSQARLQQEAYALGIDKSVTAMTQAEKSMLRYHAIMSQVTQVQGDMARTLESPANQTRILKAQIQQLSRAIGNIFIPLLNKMLPYLIAMAQMAREAAESIALFFGFTLPEVDYSSASASVGDIATDLDDANSSAKELKRTIMGFDEINRLNDTTSGASNAGAGGGVGFDMDLLEYDFLGDRLEKDLDRVKEELKEISTVAGIIGGIFAAWKIKSSLIPSIKKVIDGLDKVSQIAAGIGLIVIGISLAYSSGKSMGYNDAKGIQQELKDSILALLGTIATGIGGGLVGGALLGTVGAGIGAVIGFTVGILFGFKGYSDGMVQAAEEAYQLTDNYKVMANVISESNGIIERSQTGIDNLAKGLDRLADVDISVGAARNLADEIYALSENSNKSAYEMELMRVKVDALNNMGLEGLKLSIDETTGTIVETKDSIYDVIDALEEQAKMVALQDMLTQAYKDQYQAQYDMEIATRKNNAAWEEYNSAYQDYIALTADASWYQKNFNKDILEAEARLNKASDAVDTSAVALDNATLAYDSQSDAISYFSEQLANANNSASDWASQATASKDTTIAEMTDYGRNIVSAFDAGAKEVGESTDHVSFWSSLWDSIKNFVKNAFGIHSPSTVFTEFGENTIQGFWNGAKNVWNDMKAWWSNLELPSFKVKKPHIEWSAQDLPASDWKYKILSALGIPTQIPKLNVKWYAGGGYPDKGELFVAREAGAEMVGAIGRKTTVANNQQIVDGIYKGVYQAMRDAGGNNGGQRIVVMLPNYDVLGESFVDWHNGVVKQTGNSPLLV